MCASLSPRPQQAPGACRRLGYASRVRSGRGVVVAVTGGPALGSGADQSLGIVGLDVTRAHPARVYDCWLGGKDNFGPDRVAADRVAQLAPWVVTGARANRGFLARAVRFLTGRGVTQFLDLGAGLPAAGAVHQVARQARPDARVCYVDLDPMVLAHARALLADETTIAVAGDLRAPEVILADPDVRAHLDFTRPVGVLLVAVLHFLTPQDDPSAVVASLRDALAPASYLVVSHVADLPDEPHLAGREEATREAAKTYQELAAPFTLRTRDQIAALFTGLDLVAPGLVPVHRWRPGRGRPGPPVPVLAGIGGVPDTRRTR
jgi:SAM-dependent methyltransferase